MWMLFTSFCCLSTLVRIPSTMLNKHSKSVHSWPVLDLMGKPSLSWLFLVCSSFGFPPPRNDVRVCQTLSLNPLRWLDGGIWFCFVCFSLLIWWLTIIRFWILNQVTEINHDWSQCIIPSIHCWIWLAVFQKMFASKFMRHASLVCLFFLIISMSYLGIRIMLASESLGSSYFILYFLEEFL